MVALVSQAWASIPPHFVVTDRRMVREGSAQGFGVVAA